MVTTDFKPSIHGWPIVNSFQYQMPVLNQQTTMGFCGGMCWAALNHYYKGSAIPRVMAQPPQGSPIYQELLNEQISSLPAVTILRILDWQASPDLSHKYNALGSLGHKTLQEWPT